MGSAASCSATATRWSSAATASRSPATSPRSWRRSRSSCPNAASSTARSSSRRRPAGVRGAAGADPPRRVAGRQLAEETPAGFVAFDLLALGDEACVDGRSSSAGQRWSRRSRTSRARAPHPDDERRGEAERLVRALRGRRARRRGRQAARHAYRQNGRVMLKSSTRAPPTSCVAGYRWHKTDARSSAAGSCRPLQRRGPAAARRRRAVVHEAPARRAVEELRRWSARSRTTRGVTGRIPDRQAGPDAGRAEPVEPGRTCLQAAAGRAGAGGGYEHMEGRRFRHTAHFMRWRDDRDPSLRLRAARGAGQLRPREVLGGRSPRGRDSVRALALQRRPAVEQSLTAAGRRPGPLPPRGPRRPVAYHVLLPMEDAAARLEAAMGSCVAT